MALSPADFAAYSRATGTPYPEDPEERAELAPRVLEFRRNQLKSQEDQGVDPLSVGIGIGLAAAAGTGGVYGVRKYLQQRGVKDIPQQSGKSGVTQGPLDTITSIGFKDEFGRAPGATPPPSRQPDLTSMQETEIPDVVDQQNETVDSGAQQFLRRRVEEGQRNVTKLDESTSIPQEERIYAPSSVLPADRRAIREDRITTRLEAEQALLKNAVVSPKAAWNQSLRSSQTPGGPVNFPSSLQKILKSELERDFRKQDIDPLEASERASQMAQGTVRGLSSPLRETFSAYAQIDPEIVDREIQRVLDDPDLTPGQQQGALYRLNQLKTASQGVTGEAGVTALNLARKGKIPGTELLDEPISGAIAETKQVLNPAYIDAMANYWERRSTELPHTMKDYAKRKEAGLLNYQLPENQQSANNNAQTFAGWDKATSEALQEIYESEVGDIPQYITTIKPVRGEEARARLGEQQEYTGSIGKYFEAERAGGTQPRERAYLPVYQPEVHAGMRRKGGKKEGQLIGFPSYMNLNALVGQNRQQPTRYKGAETGLIVDTVPLTVDTITENEIAPGVMGQFKTTEVVHVPLQRTRLTTDPDTGKTTAQLVNFQIRLDSPISQRAAAILKVAPGTSLQTAVQTIKDTYGDDYEMINRKVDLVLKDTVGDTPIMSQKPYDEFDESRRQFINMLSGASYETPQKGFLVGINGEKLPYTGPQKRGKSEFKGEDQRRTNIIEAQRLLTGALESSFQQRGFEPEVAAKRASQLAAGYLPQFDKSGVIVAAKPQLASQEKMLTGQPLPDIMQRPQREGLQEVDEAVRSGYYARLEPSYGGAVSSQLRNLVKQGAEVTRQDGNVIYRLGDKTQSFPAKRLVETLKLENQDALNIAELTGITLVSEGQPVAGTYSRLSSREAGQPSISPTQRSAKPGFYYNEFGELMQEPMTSSFTGPARFAAGPIGNVLEGNYPQGGSRLSVRTSPTAELQEYNRYRLAAAAEATPGGRMVRGAQQLGAGLGAVPAGLGALSESETMARYGATGSQLQQVGNQLMAQAAYKRGQQPGATARNVPTAQSRIPTATPEAPVYGPSQPPMQGPRMGLGTQGLGVAANTELAGYARRPSAISEAVDPVQARNDAVARHLGNYISAAAGRMEGPASIAGVKLKGVGQNALRPYQAPSEGMIQQLMRAARRR